MLDGGNEIDRVRETKLWREANQAATNSMAKSFLKQRQRDERRELMAMPTRPILSPP
jgi:hypothetical protein